MMRIVEGLDSFAQARGRIFQVPVGEPDVVLAFGQIDLCCVTTGNQRGMAVELMDAVGNPVNFIA